MDTAWSSGLGHFAPHLSDCSKLYDSIWAEQFKASAELASDRARNAMLPELQWNPTRDRHAARNDEEWCVTIGTVAY